MGEVSALLAQDPAELSETPVPTPNAHAARRVPADVRLYYVAYRLLEQIQTLLGVTFRGVALGALSDRRRYAIDRVYYDRERMYHTARYNEQGLWDWERQVVEKHFSACQNVLVAAAGGGREVIALRRMGMVVIGFECHAELAAFANTVLERLGLVPDVRTAGRDECPEFATSFTGAIVGWGGYMLIRSRRRRIEFLRQLRRQLLPGAPVLLSFVTRLGNARRFKAVTRIANASRRLLGGEHVEVGDYLVPNFVHLFTRGEIERELAEAGFELAFFSPTPYGHAVGHAR
jgi:hypothetical protein